MPRSAVAALGPDRAIRVPDPDRGPRASQVARPGPRVAPRIIYLGVLGRGLRKNRLSAGFYYDEGLNFGSAPGVFIDTGLEESNQSSEGSGTGKDFPLHGFCPLTSIFY